MQLLQKIEELTLYLIEQKEEIRGPSKQCQEQKAELEKLKKTLKK